jgi:aspartate aminotransferase
VWSSLAMPMQAATAYVLDEPDEVTAHVNASRRLHATVSRAVYEVFTEAGATCRPPGAAFYMYPDLSHLRGILDPAITTGQAFADHLLDRQGVAVLAGEHFGDDPSAFRFRVATSLLYGQTADQQWEALRSNDPTALPWIAGAIDMLRSALDAMAPGAPQETEGQALGASSSVQ